MSFHNKQISLLDRYAKPNRKSAIFTLVSILAIFHIFTLKYLSQGFHQIYFNFWECHLNKMEIQTNSKIDFPSHGVTVAWPQSSITRHQNTRFCISDKQGPIESKLDM